MVYVAIVSNTVQTRIKPRAKRVWLKMFGNNLVRNAIAWIGFNRTTDSNTIEVIVLDDQKSRELRRIRTTGLAVYLHDCTIL